MVVWWYWLWLLGLVRLVCCGCLRSVCFVCFSCLRLGCGVCFVWCLLCLLVWLYLFGLLVWISGLLFGFTSVCCVLIFVVALLLFWFVCFGGIDCGIRLFVDWFVCVDGVVCFDWFDYVLWF